MTNDESNPMNNNKVLAGMSGGVDSSVAAAILLERGYDVIGATIAPFVTGAAENPEKVVSRVKTSIDDAAEVCSKLGIPHYVFDFSEFFRRKVVDYFAAEYLKGRTPNPCVHCNPIIKWGLLLKEADSLGAAFIATGHYANVIFNEESGRFFIRKGADNKKDQSYFLWKLTQNNLKRTIFPLGGMTKEETRKKAKNIGLDIHQKADSQEVCFIPEDDYRNFLRKILPDIDENIGKGKIIFQGKEAGTHSGFPFYTIGQRKGLGITHKCPLYVEKIISEENIVEVNEEIHLFKEKLTASNVNIQKFASPPQKTEFTAKIRYRDKGTPAFCKFMENGRIEVKFASPVRAVTPGQSVVLYDGKDIAAGGIID